MSYLWSPMLWITLDRGRGLGSHLPTCSGSSWVGGQRWGTFVPARMNPPHLFHLWSCVCWGCCWRLGNGSVWCRGFSPVCPAAAWSLPPVPCPAKIKDQCVWEVPVTLKQCSFRCFSGLHELFHEKNIHKFTPLLSSCGDGGYQFEAHPVVKYWPGWHWWPR